ncbi:MAG: NAD(P)/FAD-dependent oxidoreductase [Candidatus Dojkabacteria bacterium]|uniref:Protoporphyrinogen oxidase n=2 Tax=Candidatus Dojkabacteria TaxID=74243 RepID=A0A136KGJ6_9BACT|nr:MAG: Protoporphyrinogen oxidase [candidate division WS6 bacterium OLB21]MBW7953836.1 NAD(P)/FAD-dependent oxidoreductase [Candidatus Dojkabacteria bacterium]WKZ27684.1 MAG: NAD(P)/FAD-dependent oxidoreductase [Candidatus Dojkabacteria bacterium]
MANIGIIGGGYSGLTAAYHLAKNGHQVEILEKGSEVGGLAGGFKIAGTSLEKTYHHLFKTDTDIIALAQELGIADKLKWHKSSIEIFYNHRLYPFSTPLDLLRFSPLGLISRLRLAFVILLLRTRTNFAGLIRISAYDWMLKYAGQEAMKVIWQPLLLGKFSRYYKKISMAWLWARLHTRAKSRKPGESFERLGYFTGGFSTFTNSLVEKIEALGSKISINTEVQEIISSKDSVQVKTSIGEKKYDRLIVTAPSGIFAKMIANQPQAKSDYLKLLNSIDYLSAVVLVFSSNQNIGKSYWYNINDTSMPFLVFINHTNLIDKQEYNGKYIYYIGAYLPLDDSLLKKSDDEIINLWLTSLQKVFSEFKHEEIIEKHLFRFAYAQHIVTTNYQELIPDYKTPLVNVYLANFSQIFPEDRGTNYAVREGKKIADLVAGSQVL